MKTMLSVSCIIICLVTLFLLVPMAGAQHSGNNGNQEISAERIAAEKQMLENKIAELEAKPLSYYGSQKNKRTRVGFYKYRLETLLSDPEKYFSHPEHYEGNIKTPGD